MSQSIHAQPTAYVHAATQERPWWKTLLVVTLLMLIPLLGWGMAAVYVTYRGAPRNFRWTEAFFVGLLLTAVFLALGYLVWHQIELRAFAQFGFLAGILERLGLVF